MSLPRPSDETARNEAASVWMHRGMDLAASAPEGDPAVLAEAVRCFDEAIALRKTLPLAEVPFYRYGLSAGWINRGDALARQGGAALGEAIRSYDEARALLDSLDLEENRLYPRRLAIARLNLGVSLQKRDDPGDPERAAEAFRRALGVLERFPDLDGRALLQAAAWSNLAGTLASLGRDAAEEARAAARNALALARPIEETDPAATEAALGARHALARLLVQDLAAQVAVPAALAAEATDAVEEGIALARTIQERPGAKTRAWELVHFGCRIYSDQQSRFLAEFVTEYLRLDDAEALPLRRKTFDVARAAIWDALRGLQAGGLHQPGLPAQVQALREAEEKLLRRAPAA